MLKKWKILFDYRGILYFELATKKRSKFKQIVCYLLEFLVYKLANDIHCVSEKMRTYLQYNYGKKEVKVIPSCIYFNESVYTQDALYQRQLQDTIKFVYSGGMSEWQCFQETCRLIKKFQDVGYRCFFTVLTREKETAITHLKKIQMDPEFFRIKDLLQNQVPKELSKHHFGMLIRETCGTNKVASPIKFAEYLSAGLIPIMSEGIGDYSELVQRENLGIVLKYGEFLPGERELKEIYQSIKREKLKKILIELSWEKKLEEGIFKRW